MAFNPYPNLSGQVNLVAPNRSVTTPGRRPLADVSVVGEAYRNMGQVISNLGGKAAEVALRAKLDDERLAHDEATLAFASGLNQHEMDMRNNPQKYANMKYEDMQSNYMGDFGPDGTLISTIIKPYEDKPELQKSIKNTLTQMGLSSASTAFRVHSTYREKQIETEINSNLEEKRTQAFLLAQQQNPDIKAIEKIETDFFKSLEPYKTLTDPRKEFYKNKLYESMADGTLISHKVRNPNPSDYLNFLNSERGQGIVKLASFPAIYQAYTGALQGVTDRNKAQAESAQRALFISTLLHNPSVITENVEKDKVVIKQKERTAQNSKKNNPLLFHLLPDDWIASKIAAWRGSKSTKTFDPAVRQQLNGITKRIVETITGIADDIVNQKDPGITQDLIQRLDDVDLKDLPTLRIEEGNPFFKNGVWVGDDASYQEQLGLKNYLEWIVPKFKTLLSNPNKTEVKGILSDIRNENKGIWTESLNNILTTYNGITVRDSVERLAESKLNDFKNVNKKFADIAGATFPSNFNDPDNWEYGNYNQVFTELPRLMPNSDINSIDIISPEKINKTKEVMGTGNPDLLKKLITEDYPNHFGETYLPQALRQLLRNPDTQIFGALMELGQGVDSNSFMNFTRITPEDWVTISQALQLEQVKRSTPAEFYTHALNFQIRQGLSGVDDGATKTSVHTNLLARLGHAEFMRGYTGEEGPENAVRKTFNDIYKGNFLMIKQDNSASAGAGTTIKLLRDQTDRLDVTRDSARIALNSMESRIREKVFQNPENYHIRLTNGQMMTGDWIQKEVNRVLKLPGGTIDYVFRNDTRNNVEGISLALMSTTGGSQRGKVIGFINEGGINENQLGKTFFTGDSLDTLLAIPEYEEIVENIDERATWRYGEDNIFGVTVPFWPWGDDYPMKDLKEPSKHQMFQLMTEVLYKMEDPVARQKMVAEYANTNKGKSRSHAAHGYWWKGWGRTFGEDGLLEYLVYKEYQSRVYDYMEENGLRVTADNYDVNSHEYIQMVLPDEDWEMNGKPMKGMKTLANEYERYLEQGNYGFLTHTMAGLLDTSEQNVGQALWDLYGTLSLGYDPNNTRIIPYEGTPEAKIKKHLPKPLMDWYRDKKSGKAFERMGVHLMHFKGEIKNAVPSRTWKSRPSVPRLFEANK